MDEKLHQQDLRSQDLVCLGCLKTGCDSPSDFDANILDCALEKIEKQQKYIDDLMSMISVKEVEIIKLENLNEDLKLDLQAMEEDMRNM